MEALHGRRIGGGEADVRALRRRAGAQVQPERRGAGAVAGVVVAV